MDSHSTLAASMTGANKTTCDAALKAHKSRLAGVDKALRAAGLMPTRQSSQDEDPLQRLQAKLIREHYEATAGVSRAYSVPTSTQMISDLVMALQETLAIKPLARASALAALGGEQAHAAIDWGIKIADGIRAPDLDIDYEESHQKADGPALSGSRGSFESMGDTGPTIFF